MYVLFPVNPPTVYKVCGEAFTQCGILEASCTTLQLSYMICHSSTSPNIPYPPPPPTPKLLPRLSPNPPPPTPNPSCPINTQ